MEFFLELVLTAVVALLVSFLVANLVSLSMAGTSGGGVNDEAEKSEIGGDDDSVTVEELCVGMKVDAGVVQSERNLRAVVDENVERAERFKSERQEPAKGEELVIRTVEVDEFLPTVSPENVVAKEMVVRGEDGEREVAEDASICSVLPENVVAEEIVIRGQEEGSESTERRSLENVKSGSDVVLESEEVRIEESNVEESEHKVALNNEGGNEEKEELSIEEEDDDDDWEGIERSELERDFAAASNLLEESGKTEEIGAEVKMELYGLHKIATEGSCREAQPMAVMVSARAKWNAWQKIGNMSQEEAMERYLALVSKEIPGLIKSDHISGPLEDPTTLGTTGVASSKNGILIISGER